jgi:hypothetical protein
LIVRSKIDVLKYRPEYMGQVKHYKELNEYEKINKYIGQNIGYISQYLWKYEKINRKYQTNKIIQQQLPRKIL